MRLGSLKLDNRYFLAPMLNITTAPYRRFCRKYQKVGLVSVPMLYTKRIEKNPESIEKDLFKIEEERPISVQLIGSDPKALKKTIDYLESYKFDVLDLNAGCPSKRAIKAKEGGYLMKDLENLKVLIQTAVKYSAKLISLKVRTGYEKPFNIKDMAKIINDSGIDFAIIHARTVKSNFHEDALDLDTVKRLKEKLTIPLVGNGDIINPISAKHFIDYTNVDALMIGRESMGNPEIFTQIHEYFTKGKRIPFEKDFVLFKKYIKIYEDLIDEFLNGISYPISNEEMKFKELKRNAIWLSKNIRNSTTVRRDLSKAKNILKLKTIIERIE
ncbi:MAG: tRNA-dihydrouridine synthase [Candidatus Lokiarchaeota archaeon]|nr:tRNA-dihydrouridine synthase [Candidatus Lokiarchaeota archaeon]